MPVSNLFHRLRKLLGRHVARPMQTPGQLAPIYGSINLDQADRPRLECQVRIYI